MGAKSRKIGHFRRRLMERFGLSITDEQIEQETERIDSYENKPLLILENGRSFHRIQVQGTDLVILFDWDYMCFVTVYYTNWFRRDDAGKWRFGMRVNSRDIKEKDKILSRLRKMKMKPMKDFTVRRYR